MTRGQILMTMNDAADCVEGGFVYIMYLLKPFLKPFYSTLNYLSTLYDVFECHLSITRVPGIKYQSSY